MTDLLIKAFWPLLLLVPLWIALVKVGLILHRLNKGKYGKKTLAIIDGVASIRVPLFYLSVLVYVRFLVEEFIPNKNNYIFDFLDKHLFFFVSIALLSNAIIRFVNSYSEDLHARFEKEESYYGLTKSDEKTHTAAFAKVLNGTWFVITIVVILDHFGVPASSILAFGGMGSIVIGFAAKDILSDIISGVLLYFDNQFKIGDWIKIDSPALEGNVESIGWRVSKILTFDKRPVYVPNKFLGSAVIQNVTRRESMRFKESLTLDLESVPKISTICRDIKNEILYNHDGIDTDKPIIVNLESFAGEVANIYISAYSKSADTTGFYAIKQDIWVKVFHVLENHDVKIKAPKLYVR